MDFIIVSGGVIDQWMMPATVFINDLLHGGVKHHEKSQMGQFMMLLRMARLLRILRLIRLIHGIAPLYQLIVSIIKAMQGIFWVLVLTIVVLYIFALLAVRLISHGIVFGGTAPDDVAAIFPTVPEAIFVLFNMMNGDDSALGPLFREWPPSQVIYMGFTVISAWAILSFLTAVVSENMIQASDQHRQELAEQEDLEAAEAKRKALEAIFVKCADQGSSDLTEDQYVAMLEDGALAKELYETTGLEKDELSMRLYALREKDVDAEEYIISKKTFVEGLQSENREVSERSMRRLEKRVDDLERTLQKKMKFVLQKTQDVMTSSVSQSPAESKSMIKRLFTHRQ